MTIKLIHELPLNGFADFVAESDRFGCRFMRRLLDDWANNSNRFDRPGKALFGATMVERVIGVCGLNIDPYDGDARVGRVRHLYVLAAHRRQDVGGRLVAQVIAAARGRFERLRLRTNDEQAGRFYEALGFVRCFSQLNCTHLMHLQPTVEPRRGSAVTASTVRGSRSREQLSCRSCVLVVPGA